MRENIPETRYYRSFSAHRHPVQPLKQIEYSEAQQLSTYYVARFDERDRLVEFVKLLRVGSNSEKENRISFTEVYQYHESGSLQRRILQIPDQENQVWEYNEDQIPWSNYFDQFCDRWFRRSQGVARLSSAKLSLLIHEQFTELEAEIFEAAAGVPRDNEWAFKVTMLILDKTREIIDEIETKASPRICAIAASEPTEIQLQGFDDPEPNLFGFVELWRQEHPEVSRLETVTLLSKRDLDQGQQCWAADSRIGSITFAPIRAIDGNNLAIAAMLVLVTAQTLSEEKICLVNSIFRRMLHSIQAALELARNYETLNPDSPWS